MELDLDAKHLRDTASNVLIPILVRLTDWTEQAKRLRWCGRDWSGSAGTLLRPKC